jgi:hypothetical protein
MRLFVAVLVLKLWLLGCCGGLSPSVVSSSTRSPPAAPSSRWLGDFARGLCTGGVGGSREAETRPKCAVLLAAAPRLAALDPTEAAEILTAHIFSDEARRQRHDAVVRYVAAQFRMRKQVYVDKPLFNNLLNSTTTTAAAALKKKSRRVDIVVVDEEEQGVLLVEVTVLARADAATLAIADAKKRRKYADLGAQALLLRNNNTADLECETIVLAVDALTGEVAPAALTSLVLSCVVSVYLSTTMLPFVTRRSRSRSSARRR